MRRRAINTALALAAVAILFAGVTLAALEYTEEVVRLRTFDADGAAHETRTWIAEQGGSHYVEAANPERPFLENLRQRPEVEVVRGNGSVERYRAAIVPNPQGHEHIRASLRQRYGWADWWIGLLTDTSQSIEVKLEAGNR